MIEATQHNIKILTNQIIEREPECYKPDIQEGVVLYGAGDMGRLAFEYYNLVGVKVFGVVDQSILGDRLESFENVPLQNPVRAIDCFRDRNLVICVANHAIEPIRRYLISLGFKKIFHFYQTTWAFKRRHPLDNGWSAGHISKVEAQKIQENINIFADRRSVCGYLQFLAWHKFQEEWVFENHQVDIKDKFFINEVLGHINKCKVFVDVGAYDGKIIDKFIDLRGADFQKIYAFEPDKVSFSRLKKKFSNHGQKGKILISKKGLSDTSGKLPFANGFGYCSQFNKCANSWAESTTLDSLNIEADLIKYHIEGHEFQAIKGSLQTIKKNRPLLIVTIYHNRSTAIDLAPFLAKNLVNYHFLLRLHSWSGTGVVLYAIPK